MASRWRHNSPTSCSIDVQGHRSIILSAFVPFLLTWATTFLKPLIPPSSSLSTQFSIHHGHRYTHLIVRAAKWQSRCPASKSRDVQSLCACVAWVTEPLRWFSVVHFDHRSIEEERRWDPESKVPVWRPIITVHGSMTLKICSCSMAALSDSIAGWPRSSSHVTIDGDLRPFTGRKLYTLDRAEEELGCHAASPTYGRTGLVASLSRLHGSDNSSMAPLRSGPSNVPIAAVSSERPRERFSVKLSQELGDDNRRIICRFQQYTSDLWRCLSLSQIIC